jgi:hypothetical protein
MGFVNGHRVADLKFRAENSHRTPKSEKGWYFYHRSKSHYAVLGGMKMAARTGVLMSLMVGMFFVLEDQFDNIRGGQSKDCVSSVFAGTMTGGLYSAASMSYLCSVTRSRLLTIS